MLDTVGDQDLATVGKLALVASGETGGRDEPRTADDQSLKKKSVGHYLVRIIFAIVQGLLMIAILFGAYQVANRMIASKPEPRKRPAFKTVYTVDTFKAVKADNQPTFIAYGQTVAARNVELRALVSGEIVKISPNLRTGAAVKKGDPLVEIDNFSFRGALAEAKANMEEAEARIVENEAQILLEKGREENAREQLEFAMADMERAEKLFVRKSLTQQEMEARKLIVSQRKQSLAVAGDTIKVQEARLEQLKATLGRLQWGIDRAQRDLDSTVLVAPFSGVVRSSTAEIGRAITANDVVVSLYEADSLEVRFTLSDAQYGRLQTSEAGLVGRNVSIAWTVGGKEYVYPASIDRVGAEITSNRGGVEVLALMEKTNTGVPLRPGAFVEVRVPDITFDNTYAIPDTAIYDNDTVYKVVDGTLRAQKITVAAFEGERAIIMSGLIEGDEILTTRIAEVSDGLAVRREGDPVRPASVQGAGSTGTEKANGAGRPNQAEMQKILAANEISAAQFRALPQPERRALVAKWRKANPAQKDQ